MKKKQVYLLFGLAAALVLLGTWYYDTAAGQQASVVQADFLNRIFTKKQANDGPVMGDILAQ